MKSEIKIDYTSLVMTEYKELRQEVRNSFQIQNSLIALDASISGILIGLGMSIFLNGNYGEKYYYAISFLFCAIMPAVSMFLGIIWLDQVYRQVKLGAYIRNLENIVNRNVNAQNDDNINVLNWEHWVAQENQGKPLLLRTNYYYYFFCMAVFLLCPIICLLYGLWMVKYNVSNIWLPIAIGVITYILFVGFSIRYVRVILRYTDFSDK